MRVQRKERNTAKSVGFLGSAVFFLGIMGAFAAGALSFSGKPGHQCSAMPSRDGILPVWNIWKRITAYRLTGKDIMYFMRALLRI